MLDNVNVIGSSPGSRIPLARSPLASGDDFSLVVEKLISNSVQSFRKSENIAISGIKDEASVSDVVSSVLEAERSLHLALSIRDKVVAAFHELTRMQV